MRCILFQIRKYRQLVHVCSMQQSIYETNMGRQLQRYAR